MQVSDIIRGIALSLLILLCGCGGAGKPAPAKPAAADRSLSLSEYEARGVPSIEQAWTFTDYQLALQAFTNLVVTAPAALPRARSEKSGALIDHLVNTANLEVFYNEQEPVDLRMMKAVQLFDAVNRINQVFFKAFNEDQSRAPEAMKMMGLILHLSKAMVKVVDEFAPTLDRNDPTYPSRVHGMVRMKSGMSTILFGVLMTFDETDLYDTESRIELARQLGETYEAIAAGLPQDYRKQFEAKIKRLSEEADHEEIRARMKELNARLEAKAAP